MKDTKGLKTAIRETNRIFRDFEIPQSVKYEDWKSSSVIALENYRKSVIDKYLSSY